MNFDPLAETPANIERVAAFFDRYHGGHWPDSCGPAVGLLRELRGLRDSAPTVERGDSPPAAPASNTAPAGEGPEAGTIPCGWWMRVDDGLSLKACELPLPCTLHKPATP